MTDDCERLADIQQVLDEIVDRSLCGAVVLVEGKRDLAALCQLGIPGEIVMTSQQSLLPLAEELARSGADTIVLTDWDERGEEVARQIETFMVADGARPDLDLRDRLGHLLRREIKDIESLFRFVDKLRETCASKPQHY